MLSIFRGATFQVAGSVQLDGVPTPTSGWILTATVFDITGTTVISELTVNWLDQTQGLLALSAADTSNWPPGKARIDMQVNTGMETLLSPPEYIRILESPLS